MAFTLTAFKTKCLDIGSVSDARGGLLMVTLKCTALTTDTALDIGTDAGTFWTAVKANAVQMATGSGVTYGAMATQAFADFTGLILPNVTSLDAVWSEEISCNMLRVAAGAEGAGAYSMAVANHRPNIVFGAANGLASFKLNLVYSLAAGQFPIIKSYG